MSIVKKRLSPEESRLAALMAARELLVESGPQAVTLKAVAARIGRTHANLLHHFGSALDLQKALAAHLAESVCETIGEMIRKKRAAGGEDPQEVIDLTFDAFDKGGAGALVSWMLLSGHHDALAPIVEAIHRLVDEIAEGGHEDRPVHEDTLQLVLMAMGDAMVGKAMSDALGLPRTAARDIAARALRQSLIAYGELTPENARKDCC